MFQNYIKITWRNITRRKGYSFINIAGLALGMACFIAIATYIQFELSFDKFHKNGNLIFRLVERQSFEGQDEKNLGQSTPWMAETLTEYPDVHKAVNFVNMGTIWTKHEDEMVKIPRVLLADPDVFEVFSFKLLRGDPQTALLEPNTVVVTEDTAHRIFKEDDPVGKTLRLPDDKDHLITGVVRNVPPNSHIQFDMLVSIMEMRNQPVNWDNYDHYSPTYILFEQGADPTVLESKFSGHAKKYFRHNAEYISLSLQPLRDIHLHSKHIIWEINWQKGDIMDIYFFSIIMLFILLVACINFINLSTARSVSRALEVGVRKVMGANKIQLIRQFIGESLLFFLCALLLAIGILHTIRPVLAQILGDSMSFNYLNNWIFALGILIFLIGAGIVAGIYPAFVLSSFQPVFVIKRAFSHGKKTGTIRKVLVIVQFAVSIMMILSTIVVSKQFEFMKAKDTGYNKDQVVTLPMTDDMQQHFDAIREDLSTNPEIKGVTASTRQLGTPLWRNEIFFERKKPGEKWISPYMAVDYDFVSFYGLELVEGRDFSRNFADDSNSRSYIINETLAKQIGWEKPVGQKFRIGDTEWGKVIGVVKDFNFRSLHHRIEPVAFYVFQPWLFHMSIRIGAVDTSQTLKYLEDILKPYSTDKPLLYSFLDEEYARLYKNEETSSYIFGIFSLLAIAISCLGLLALASFTAEQKTKEIGIRKILGSSIPDIIVLLSRRFIKWVMICDRYVAPEFRLSYPFGNRHCFVGLRNRPSFSSWHSVFQGLSGCISQSHRFDPL
jgi:putative ABC transport system permease protein